MRNYSGYPSNDKGLALQYSALSGHLANVKYLLSLNGIEDAVRATALRSAVATGQINLIKHLVDEEGSRK